MTTSILDKKKIKTILALLFWLAVWQAAALAVGQELILPAPLTVLRTFFGLTKTKIFWESAAWSLFRIFTGYLAGVLLGTLLAVLTHLSGIAEALISPVMRLIRATPVASFIILALLWLGKSKVPGFASILMVVPVIWGGTYTAITETDRELLEMADAYRFGTAKKIMRVYVPSIMPAWSSGCVTSIGLAWKAGIAAEVLCLPSLSVGTYLYYSKVYLETPALFAWTSLVIVMSYILEKAFVRLIGTGRKKKKSKAAGI